MLSAVILCVSFFILLLIDYVTEGAVFYFIFKAGVVIAVIALAVLLIYSMKGC